MIDLNTLRKITKKSIETYFNNVETENKTLLEEINIELENTARLGKSVLYWDVNNLSKYSHKVLKDLRFYFNYLGFTVTVNFTGCVYSGNKKLIIDWS